MIAVGLCVGEGAAVGPWGISSLRYTTESPMRISACQMPRPSGPGMRISSCAPKACLQNSMALADSRRVSCGVTVCIPAGAPGAPAARGAERVERPAERRAPARRPADLRAGALRRAAFFEVFFFAMVSSPDRLPKPRRGPGVNGTLRSVDCSRKRHPRCAPCPVDRLRTAASSPARDVKGRVPGNTPRRNQMTRLGMVVLGLMATAAAIAVAVGVATGPSQQAVSAELTPPQVAELRSGPVPAKVRAPAQPADDDEDGGAQSLPQDGDGEDGPGSRSEEHTSELQSHHD